MKIKLGFVGSYRLENTRHRQGADTQRETQGATTVAIQHDRGTFDLKAKKRAHRGGGGPPSAITEVAVEDGGRAESRSAALHTRADILAGGGMGLGLRHAHGPQRLGEGAWPATRGILAGSEVPDLPFWKILRRERGRDTG